MSDPDRAERQPDELESDIVARTAGATLKIRERVNSVFIPNIQRHGSSAQQWLDDLRLDFATLYEDPDDECGGGHYRGWTPDDIGELYEVLYGEELEDSSDEDPPDDLLDDLADFHARAVSASAVEDTGDVDWNPVLAAVERRVQAVIDWLDKCVDDGRLSSDDDFESLSSDQFLNKARIGDLTIARDDIDYDLKNGGERRNKGGFLKRRLLSEVIKRRQAG